MNLRDALDAPIEPYCYHREGSGQADENDEQFSPGDVCPYCLCTLGTDGYWYVDADQAPKDPPD